MSIHIIQSDEWPYRVTLVNTDKTLNLSIQLAEFGSKDSIHEANARPANITLFAHLKLFAAAPEMYELLAKIRGHIDSTCRECESKSIVPEIDALLAKIEGGGE